MSRFVKRYWWIIIFGFIVPLTYAITRILSPSFLDGFIGNWLATVLGLAFGIPIGLEVERLQSQKESRNRKLKILGLVKKELEFNHGLISKNWVGKDPLERGSFIGGNLKDELWNAFSDGGEIEWIDNIELLDKIADAYYHIRQLSVLSQKMYSASLITPMSLSKAITGKINNTADVMGGMAEVIIEKAIDAIVTEQKELNS